MVSEDSFSSFWRSEDITCKIENIFQLRTAVFMRVKHFRSPHPVSAENEIKNSHLIYWTENHTTYLSRKLNIRGWWKSICSVGKSLGKAFSLKFFFLFVFGEILQNFHSTFDFEPIWLFTLGVVTSLVNFFLLLLLYCDCLSTLSSFLRA